MLLCRTCLTAHMADHSLGAALYALKAVKRAGQSVAGGTKWQNEQLPAENRELVLTKRCVFFYLVFTSS